MSSPYYGFSGYGFGKYGNQPIESLPIGYYLALLSHEYRNSPKLNALLYVLLKKFDDVTNCMVLLDTAFDLDSAIGAQLDVLGGIVGAARVVLFQPSGGVSPTLDDDTYRIYIKSKIVSNAWDGHIDSLQNFWVELFPGGSIAIADNQNMTATIFLTGAFTSIIQDLIVNGYIVPRPEGVLYDYVFTTLPAFGFGSSPGFIAGFDEGKWA